jgi:hypothetical protein
VVLGKILEKKEVDSDNRSGIKSPKMKSDPHFDLVFLKII